MVLKIIMLIDAVTGESRQATTNSMELGFLLYKDSNHLQHLI